MSPEFEVEDEVRLVRFGGRSHVVGLVVFRLLMGIFAAYPASRRADELATYVWGREGVPRTSLESACHRARVALRKLKHPLRLNFEGQRVVLI